MERIKKLKNFIFLILMISTNVANSKPKASCKIQTKHCKYIDYMRQSINFINIYSFEELICKNSFDDEMVKALEKTWLECPHLQASNTKISINSRNRPILDESFGVFKLNLKLSQADLGSIIKLNFLYVKGFDIESVVYLNKNLVLDNLYSDFKLYKKNRLVKSCSDFLNSNSRGFIFRSKDPNNLISFTITRPNNIYPICSLFFRNINNNQFSISSMFNSYYLKNTISFIDPTKLEMDFSDFNCSLNSFQIIDSYGLNIDSQLLNSNIFAKTQYLNFESHINSIQNDVFKTFKMIISIKFDSNYLIQLIRKQGIEWIKNIDSDIDVNITNDTSIVVLERLGFIFKKKEKLKNVLGFLMYFIVYYLNVFLS